MNVEVVPAASLTAEQLARWSQIQSAHSTYESPFFSPQFTRIVAKTRDDVYVGLVEQGREAVAFFPFQIGRFRAGRPVGWKICDYQGVVAEPGVEWNAKDLIGASGLRAWEFDHVVAAQREFERFAHTRATSPVIEISSDLEALLQERHAAGVREIRAALRKMRKLEREHGDLRFVPHETAPEALATLLRWKQQQYLQTGVVDVLARPWVRQTLELAHATHDEGFAGLLSLLYAGDTLVAAHLGLRSRRVWHYWFPAYDPRFARYSPGIALLLKMVEHASALGIGSIDLGKGDARYKSSLANTTVPLVEGRVELPSIAAAAGRLRRGVKTLGRRTTLARPVRRAIRRAARRR